MLLLCHCGHAPIILVDDYLSSLRSIVVNVLSILIRISDAAAGCRLSDLPS